MSNNTLKEAILWAESAIEIPTEKHKSTQIGVHLEEFTEFLSELDVTDAVMKACLYTAKHYLERVAHHFKEVGDVSIKNPILALDALCDNIQTAACVAHTHGYDLEGAMQEVVNSNFSKYVDRIPIFDENMKIKKGPNYYKPNLEPFI